MAVAAIGLALAGAGVAGAGLPLLAYSLIPGYDGEPGEESTPGRSGKTLAALARVAAGLAAVVGGVAVLWA